MTSVSFHSVKKLSIDKQIKQLKTDGGRSFASVTIYIWDADGRHQITCFADNVDNLGLAEV
jgi:hypothetical protein